MQSYIFKYHKTHLIWSVIILFISFYFHYTKIFLFTLSYILFCFYFFRIPQNIKIRNNDDYIVAPAFGKIIDIKDRDEFIQISIFINIFDPHIQYAPVSCYVKHKKYVKGNFTPAFLIKSENNERMVYYANNKNGKIIFSQIAGTIANTIVSFINKESFVKQGQEIGLIKFGSRSDILIEKKPNLKIQCKVDDNVKGGQTILASYN